MSLLMFDGASAFDLAAARAAGGIAASVYIVGSPGGMPHADAARVNQARATGLGAVANWERAADFFSTCSVPDAQAAGVEAFAACPSLGFPADGSNACYFSFDFDCPPSRFPEMLTKIRATQAGLTPAYQARAYGQQALIGYLAANGFPGKHWLMVSTFGLPYPIGPNVAAVQGHDAAGNWLDSPIPSTDVSTVLDPHALGAWWPDGSPYAKPAPKKEHAGMFTTNLVDASGTPTTVHCIFGEGLHYHGADKAFTDVLARVADAGPVNQTQHDWFAGLANIGLVAKLPAMPGALDIAKAVVAAMPASTGSGIDEAQLAADLASAIAAHVTLASK